MSMTPKPSPQADRTPESLNQNSKKLNRDHSDKRPIPVHSQTEAGDEHLGAKENQISDTAAPAGLPYADEPKQG